VLRPALRETLDGLAARHGEPGGAVCVVVDGEVVEETVGTVDGTTPWATDTLVMTYSVAKPFAALAVLTVVAEGRLGLETPVADLWPEYAAHGKGATTVAHVLAHQAGLSCFPPEAADLAFDDRDALVALLADAVPEHEPGTAVAEHALTYGHLCDELVRRATGQGLAERFAAVAARHGWDLHLVVPEAERHRVADVVPVRSTWPRDYLDDPAWAPAISRPAGTLDPDVLNSERWRGCSFPAISLHASARALAGFYADLSDPAGAVTDLLGEPLRAAYVGARASGIDRVLRREVTWTLGFQLDPDEIGMGGAGGCSAWATPTYAAAWVTRGLGDHGRGERVFDAIEANVAR
jgi:CubicO group peptidase (beta-lactamase class C family)